MWSKRDDVQCLPQEKLYQLALQPNTLTQKQAGANRLCCSLINLCNEFLKKNEAQPSAFFFSVFGSTVSARRARNGASFWVHFLSVA